MPLRVCIDARLRTGQWGGVEQVLIGLAAGLSKLEGEEEYLFLTHAGEDDWLTPYLGGACRTLHTRRSRVERRARAVTRALLERLPRVGTRFAVRPSDGTVERSAIDVMHFPFQDAFLTGVPSLYQPHDLQHLHLPELFTGWERARREAIYRTHCAAATVVISMTSWGRMDLIEQYGLSPEKVAVVPWGSVLWEYPDPTPADLDSLRRELSLPAGFLLYPARTWPHKNQERLIEALALLKTRDGVTIPLICPGGDAGGTGRLRERAEELGLAETTSFPGFVSPLQLRGLYRQATALIFPSLFEGWGLPISEAFSEGLPVASSSTTCLPDLVDDAGILFDPSETEEIAAAAARIWTDADLRATLARRGRQRADLFSFDATARLLRAHYRRVGGRSLSEEDRILLEAEPVV
jgi:glycosyltransferase involved in cell wall biosynthesis